MTGCTVRAYPKMNARTIASTICTALPQPKIVATAMPRTSPMAQPIRQCVVAESAARLRSASACACKALNGGEELLALLRRGLGVAGGKRVRDAVVHVVVEHLEREALEGGVHRPDLREDVDAVAVVLDHPLDTAYLPFDSVQALRQRRLVVSVLHATSLALWKRLSRRLLVTTNSDDDAMAAAAMIGLSRPATARGTAATL